MANTHAKGSYPTVEDLLHTCDEEVVNTPGNIQAHGMLMVISPLSMEVLYISDNVTGTLGIPAQEIIGKRLTDFLDDSIIENAMQVTRTNSHQPLQSFTAELNTTDGMRTYNVMSHVSMHLLLIEFEAVDITQEAPLNQQRAYDLFNAYQHRLKGIYTEREAFEFTCKVLRELTGFDRVKVYSFDLDWNGSVIAEDLAEGVDSYLGQSFPASDIPQQSRQLYTQNFLRLVSDIGIPSSQILSHSSVNQPLDLSFSLLRGVTPVHVEYLQNMGINSTLTISILEGNTLWGMVSCHHRTPLFIPFYQRKLAELIAHALSSYISHEEHKRRADHMKALQLNHSRMISSVTAGMSLTEIVASEGQEMASAMNASCMIISAPDSIQVIGTLSSTLSAESFTTMIRSKMLSSEPYVVHCLSKPFPSLFAYRKDLSGVIAIALDASMDTVVIWVRPEVATEIVWAGKDEKRIYTDESGAYRLGPRASFERWKEHVEGRCEPWSRRDLHQAQELARLLAQSQEVSASYTPYSVEQAPRFIDMIHTLEESWTGDDATDQQLLSSRNLARSLIFASVDLSAEFTHALESMRVALKTTHPYAHITFDPLPILKTDVLAITQVVLTLCDYTIKSAAHAEQQHVHIAPVSEGNGPQLTITQQGFSVSTSSAIMAVPESLASTTELVQRLQGALSCEQDIEGCLRFVLMFETV